MTDEVALSTRHLHQEDLARRWKISPRTLERWRGSTKASATSKSAGVSFIRLADSRPMRLQTR